MAVLILAIGIGVNVAAFSLFNMVALKPLPVRDPASFVRLERRSLDSYTSEMAYPSFAFYRDHARTLSAAMAVLGVPPMQIDDDLQPTSASFVTPNYFTELGTPRGIRPSLRALARQLAIRATSCHSQLRTLAASLLRRSLHHRPRPSTSTSGPPPSSALLPTPSPALAASIPSSGCRWRSNLTSLKAVKLSLTGTTRLPHVGPPRTRCQRAKPPNRNYALSRISFAKQHPEAVWDQNEFIQVSPGGHLAGHAATDVSHLRQW